MSRFQSAPSADEFRSTDDADERSTLASQGENNFYFDIKVVDGTHAKDEKAQYVAEAFAAFGKLLGQVHEESYIYVHDVRAEAYGFGGLTQEYRYIKAKP